MMKRYSLSCVALQVFLTLALFLITSCAEHYADLPQSETISFKVALSDRTTRSDEGQAEREVNHLYYWIYSVDENGNANDVLEKGDVEAFAGETTATVEARLVPGVTYKALFFACDYASVSSGIFTLSDAGNLDIDYAKMESGIASVEAFYSCEKISVSGGTHDVKLKRPFAQINIGSDDLQNLSVQNVGIQNFQTELKLESGVYSKLDMLNGTVSGELGKDEYILMSDVPKNLKFPVEGYSMLQSHYILCGNDGPEGQSLIDANFRVYKRNASNPITSFNLAATPVKANFRTNITGSLLTGQNDIKVGIDNVIGSGTDIEIVDNRKIVNSSAEFLAALQSGGDILVPSGTEFTVILKNDNSNNNYCLALPNKANVTIDGNVTVTLPSGVYDNGKYTHFLVQNDLKIGGKGELRIKGGSCFIETMGDANEIDVRGISLTSEPVITGTVRRTPVFIRSLNSSQIHLTDLTVSCCSSILEIKNTDIRTEAVIENCNVSQPTSESSSSYNLFYVNNAKAGGNLILNNVTVKSYNTIMAVNSDTGSGSAVIKDCDFTLLQQKARVYLIKNLSNNTVAFTINIQSGNYYYKSGASNSKYGIAGYEGNILIYGGMFNVKPYIYSYEGTTTEMGLPEGYEWHVTGDTTYPYTVRIVD